MNKVISLMYTIISPVVAGILMVVALVAGYDTAKPLVIAIVLGFILALPISWLVGRAIYMQTNR